jgi:hypothetical protein
VLTNQCAAGTQSRQRRSALVEEAPALLWSCAGSGNTFLRSLIELATDRLTGSVYHDRESSEVFAAELRPVNTTASCARLSVVKVHGVGNPIKFSQICGGTVRRAVFLIRHPFRAALAEYQRTIARVDSQLERAGKRPPLYANGSAPNTNARAANVTASLLHNGWRRRGPVLAQRWARLVECYGSRLATSKLCKDVDGSYGAWLASSAANSGMWVRYEDLSAPSSDRPDVARAELERVIKFACPSCLIRSHGPRLPQSRAVLEWGHRKPYSSTVDLSDIVEAGGAAAHMWMAVRHVAPQFGYERFNYDAVGWSASIRAAREKAARYFALHPSPAAARGAGPLRERR